MSWFNCPLRPTRSTPLPGGSKTAQPGAAGQTSRRLLPRGRVFAGLRGEWVVGRGHPGSPRSGSRALSPARLDLVELLQEAGAKALPSAGTAGRPGRATSTLGRIRDWSFPAPAASGGRPRPAAGRPRRPVVVPVGRRAVRHRLELLDGTMVYLPTDAHLPLVPGHEWVARVVDPGGPGRGFAVGGVVVGESGVGSATARLRRGADHSTERRKRA